jgi:hypothetical protein
MLPTFLVPRAVRFQSITDPELRTPVAAGSIFVERLDGFSPERGFG